VLQVVRGLLVRFNNTWPREVHCDDGTSLVVLRCSGFPPSSSRARQLLFTGGGKTAATATPSQTTPRTVKDSFDTIEVDLFENRRIPQFPGSICSVAEGNRQAAGECQSISRSSDGGAGPTTPNARVLRLTGLITNYKPGSRAVRYMGLGGVVLRRLIRR